MDFETFKNRFHEAAVVAREFAQRFILEDLPSPLRFRLRLNSSFERAKRFHHCSAKEIVKTLWRNGSVPEWVDLRVISENEGYTLIEVIACGRYTDDEKLLYHTREGRPPFHVTGPAMPPDYGWKKSQKIRRFSIHQYTECWNRSEFENAIKNRGVVWSLDLVGSNFTDHVLENLPHFPQVESFQLKCVPVMGRGLRGLRNLPKVRGLRITLIGVNSFSFKQMPKLGLLETLTLRGMPANVESFESLSQKTPMLSRMTVQSTEDWNSRNFPKLTKLNSLHLYLERLLSGLELSQLKKLQHLSLSGSAFTNLVVEDLLTQLPKLKHLNLNRCGVSDSILKAISEHHNLISIDLSHTNVNDDALDILRQNRSNLKIYPGKYPGKAK